MIDLTDGYHYAIVFDKERIIEKKKDLPIPYCNGFCCQNYQYLTPVPSYEEWQASYNCMLENEVLRLKNTKLKELLKECREVMSTVGYIFATVKQVKRARKLLENIDEVIK